MKTSYSLRYLLLNLVLLCLVGCQTPRQKEAEDAQRFVWVTGLKPEKAEYYEALHADPWPGVSQMISECNIRNMSIHKREIEGKPYLILYLEYVGDDFEADMAKMATDPETQRWWKETDPCQIPLPEAAAKGSIWADTEELFYQP
jgi:L-rhamnose mutarotase